MPFRIWLLPCLSTNFDNILYSLQGVLSLIFPGLMKDKPGNIQLVISTLKEKVEEIASIIVRNSIVGLVQILMHLDCKVDIRHSHGR